MEQFIEMDGYNAPRAKARTLEDSKSGEFKRYYKNGQLEKIGMLHKGKTHGEWKMYHHNGQLKQVINFKYGKKSGSFQIL